MRCTRCDRIAVPQTLGKLPGGRLVFGWCRECLIEAHCEPIDASGIQLTAPRRFSIRRLLLAVRRAFKSRREHDTPAGRKLAALGIAGLMAAWALILTFVGGLKLPRSRAAGPLGSGAMLLAGGGLMALVSLFVWIGLIDRAQRLRVLLKVVQVASAIVTFGTLAWGIVSHEPARDALIVIVAAVGLAITWAVRQLECRLDADRPSTTLLSRK